MIVKNEQAVLARCLDSARLFADEIIVVDTGSTDQTPAIARHYTSRVYDYAWHDDFAAARNHSYSLASGDFIMWLDADEVISESDCARICELKETLPPDIDVVHMLLRSGFGTNHETVALRDRMIRRSLGANWLYAVHEGIPMHYVDAFGCSQSYRSYSAPDIIIDHRKVAIQDPFRNIRILEKMKASSAPFHPVNLYYYIRELFIAGRYAEAWAGYLDLKNTGLAAYVVQALPFAIWSLQRSGRWENAESELYDALNWLPSNPLLCCELGNCLSHSGRDDLAEAWYLRSLEFVLDTSHQMLVFPAYYDYIPCQKLARLYGRSGRMNLAAEYNERAGRARPESLSVALNRIYFSGDAETGADR